MSKRVIQPGNYEATPIKVETWAAPKPKVKLYVDVHLEDGTTARRAISFYMTEKAMPYSEEKLNRLGFNWDIENPSMAHQGKLQVYCKHRQGSDGNTYEDWNLSEPRKGKPEAPPEAMAATKDIFSAARDRAMKNGTASSARPLPQNQNEAWDQITLIAGKEATEEAWNKAIKSVENRSKKDVNFFTPVEWQGVVDHCAAAPF